MRDFTDLDAIKRIDPQDSLNSTNLTVQQMESAWSQVNQISVSSDDYKDIKNIIFCGMGASINGALVLKALLGREMPLPSEIIADYFLPDYVDKTTLIVLVSYSGTTEEVLSCSEEAKAKGAKMIVLTKGGPLAEFAKDNNLPAYIFDGKLNPAGTPRLGNGYTVLGLIGLLNKIGIIPIEEKEVENAIIRLKEDIEDLRKQAIADIDTFFNKIPIVLAAEHLSGNAQILRNQFNETSKTFSAFYIVPDLNHHLMEGLQFPIETKLHFLVLNSPNYSEKIRRRIELTVSVIKQNGHAVHEFMTSGATVYDDFLESLQYGSFLTLYLALAYDQNPAINPWVDWFKSELGKNS